MKVIKISPLHFSFIMIGFLIGSSAISYPAKGAMHDAWLAHIIGWAGGYILITLYIIIYNLNDKKNLMEILISVFGKTLGRIVGVLYIFYFIHIASLILRSYGEYSASTTYLDTPILFIIVSIVIVIAYSLKKGLESISRLVVLTLPVLFILLILITIIAIPYYDIREVFPFLERGLGPVLKTSLVIATFPFGETVMFLMVFPILNNQKKIFKTCYLSLFIAGLALLIDTLIVLLSLGPHLNIRHLFSILTLVGLMNKGSLEPIISVSILIGVGVKSTICIYAASLGISQLLDIDNHKLFILPVTGLTVSLSIWIHKNYPEMFQWGGDISPYYSLLFQLLFPIMILIISILNKRKNKSKCYKGT